MQFLYELGTNLNKLVGKDVKNLQEKRDFYTKFLANQLNRFWHSFNILSESSFAITYLINYKLGLNR